MITLESLQTKLVDIRTAKGLRKVYNRLKWPIDALETQKTRQVIERNTQIFHFALTAQGNRILSQTSEKATEMLSASQGYVHSRVLPATAYKLVCTLSPGALSAYGLRLIRNWLEILFNIEMRSNG